MKYDDILIPTDDIYLRYMDKDRGEPYLRKISGFKMEFLGRKIGIHRSEASWMWQATDLKTGCKLNRYDFVNRGRLIDSLYRNQDEYLTMFSNREIMCISEEEFKDLWRKMHECK